MKVGSSVEVLLWNDVSSKYYGPTKRGVLVEYDSSHYEGNWRRPYHVQFDDGTSLWVKTREIRVDAYDKS